ncbi:MAG: tetratricopeptide repeat protein [Opitutae bacterium]
MSPKIFILFILGFSFYHHLGFELGANPRNRSKTEEEKVYLFPGTGLFIKNRDPYKDEEAKMWFLEAVEMQRSGELSDALKLYEKFTKRRCDLIVDFEGESVLIGPESIYRAAMIREKQGDWKKAFDHLQLVAKAYVRYDFERVASSLMSIAERIATEDLPKKWGVVPRLRSGSEDRERLNQIVELTRGPKFAPRALMVLAEIALKDSKKDEAVHALERLVNYYPEHYLAEKAYFMLGNIHQDFVSGPSYDQGSTLQALNYYEDYIILFEEPPGRGTDETPEQFEKRLAEYLKRKKLAQEGRNQMRESLAQSKLEIGKYVEQYGKYFLVRWKELGNQPALQFYNQAITTAPESKAAREAEVRVAELRNE